MGGDGADRKHGWHGTPGLNMQRLFLIISVLCILMVPWAAVAHADAAVEHRITLGIKMFPMMVGGNLGLKSMRSADGTVLLLILYRESLKVGEQVADRLHSAVERIQTYPIRVIVTRKFNADTFPETPVAGVFLAEPFPSEQRDAIIDFGIKKKAIVFSPFEGDVPKGVLAGIHVSTRVQPALNLSTIQQAGIRINKLFLKVAKIHE